MIGGFWAKLAHKNQSHTKTWQHYWKANPTPNPNYPYMTACGTVATPSHMQYEHVMESTKCRACMNAGA